MKIGKVSEPVLKRSVLKYLKPNNDYVITGAAVGADCALFSNIEKAFSIEAEGMEQGSPDLKSKKSGILAAATASVSGEKSKRSAAHAIYRATNNLAAGGTVPFAVQLHIMLPERYREIALKRIMEEAAAAAEELHITISGGHTEVMPQITTPIISATALGYRKNDLECAESLKSEKDMEFKDLDMKMAIGGNKKNVTPGQEIIMTKWIGISATALLAQEKEEELLTRYPLFFIKSAQNLEQYYSIIPEAATASKSGISAMHDVAGGGIFGALWELGERSGVGLQVDLKKIPIKQETVEVCEFFGYNPYEIRSDGALLIVTSKGHSLVEKLAAKGIPAEIIGIITDNNDKVIINDDERRFLEPPRK